MAKTLTDETLTDLPADVARPTYDRSALTPGILHVGVGNFHRAHMAVYLDRLMEAGHAQDWALVGAGVRPGDARMRTLLSAQDWMSTVVELDPDGLSARVIGPMIDFVAVEPEATRAAMADPAIRILSLTITEGGYYVDALTGGFDADHPDMQADIAAPAAPRSVFGLIVAAMRDRRDGGHGPVTILSCDNLPENGHVAKQAVLGLASRIDADLAAWIEAGCTFPNSMVDCITPATSEREIALVRDEFGIADAAPVTCEPFRQWVMEDSFAAGRPPFEEAGVTFTEDVASYELMKLRILNGGHAAIAYPSALLGHHFVHEAMADPRISTWLRALVEREVIPTLGPIPGVDYADYLDAIVARFSNPRIGDTIARLCLDGSNRQPKFILPTIKDRLAKGEGIEGLALEVALWCRYAQGVADDGTPIALDDPNAAELAERARAAATDPAAFLGYRAVFGGLVDNATFANSFEKKLTDITETGTAATLAAYTG
ncbi:mannitol dehydrogenase family protein [Roseobacter sp. HKCCA0434]|uniref:mannitol dehydrogenase family protein n=1 Tax=Roseobacter sp. HKCCA0434 TaxID=3079297 RepID=UPI002905D9EB|nr:mannitol dehydrogenase family protein [Roseobacter sp. HKCCA0434]